MTVKQKNNVKDGIFYITTDNNIVAEMVYVNISEDVFVITHTEVDESLRGKGVGNLLVDKAVDYARRNGKKIKSACTFAKALLEKNNQFKDVIY